jgi:HK97 family phage major capsid protein
VKIDIASLRGLDAHKSALEELGTRLQELEAEAAGTPFSEDQKVEFEQLLEDRETLAGIIGELETRQAAVASVLTSDRATDRPAAYGAPNVTRTPDDIYDLSAYRDRARTIEALPGVMRDGAMRVIEAMDFPTVDRAKGQQDLARILAKHRDDKAGGIAHGKVAARIIGTSSPLYAEAYAAAMTNRPLTPRMQAVLQTYSDSDGGVAIPVAIDPTFINVSDGTVNPLRAISRVETTTAKTWQATTTAGVTAAYIGERTTTGAADSAPSDIDDPTATPVRADVALDVSMEYLADYGSAQLLAELGSLIQVAKDDLEADKFFTGDGTGEPEGITAAIITDTTSIVTTITDNTFALADLDKLIGQLGPKFRSRATATATLPILQLARAFATAAQPGDSVYDDINQKLRGYPAKENTAMDTVATDAKHIVLLGAFGVGFVIVDRLGLTTRVVDARDTNGRPTGNSVIYAAWRNTSKVLAFNAFRLLKVQ